ncbi:MAG TPA: L-lactate dehydrogenase [Terriglobales bacterium]|nr:L-lactate dehydrogenase [Terriglobales bacterium]
MAKTRVAIIGAGKVGATFAYGLLMSGVANEIVLIDSNRAKAEGEVMDLEHAQAFAPPTRIAVGEYGDCADASVIVVTAGGGRQPGDSRLDLLKKNHDLLAEIIASIVRHNPRGVILIATNPVDVLTYAALQLSGLPAERVIGSGTILDTARFRTLLSQHFDVDTHSVHAHIIGEHGDSEVPVWSQANIAGINFAEFCQLHGVPGATLGEIFIRTRDAGAAVIQRKGATYYGIAASLVQIVAAIVRDQNTVLSVSSLVRDYYGINDVCLSLPTVLNRSGVKEVLPLRLSEDEIGKLRHSAEVLRTSIAALAGRKSAAAGD